MCSRSAGRSTCLRHSPPPGARRVSANSRRRAACPRRPCTGSPGADRGYLRHTSDRRYSLGSRLIPLGADAHALLGERALPALRGLAELTGETANLAVLTQGRAEYVAQAPGRHTMRTFTEVGNRVELHCTGVGKALLGGGGRPGWPG